MIILSVDYGDRRTGIALCDKMEILASPVTVIEEWNADILSEKIVQIATEKNAELIVIGLPVNMDGSLGFRSEACRELSAKISAISEIRIDFCDERLTTVSAHRIMNDADVSGKKRKAVIDAVSAVLILEDYIAKRKHKQ